MPNIGPLEMAIVLIIVLVIFGPKRLPGLGKQLGTGMREFKDSITGTSKDEPDDDDANTALGRPELHAAATSDEVPSTQRDDAPVSRS